MKLGWAAIGLLLMAQSPSWAATTWEVDTQTSKVSFEGGPPDESETGSFKITQSSVVFDPEDLKNSTVMIEVGVKGFKATARAQDILPDKEWFHVKKFPIASFKANSFEAKGNDQFLAKGTLTIKGIEQPLDFAFQFVRNGTDAKVVGSFVIMRSKFEIGTGEWSDPKSIREEVKVDVLIQAKAKP